jgi:hypothetical protein
MTDRFAGNDVSPPIVSRFALREIDDWAINRNTTAMVARAKGSEMSKSLAVVIYLAVMIALIVGVDFAFFKSQFWERLMVNIGIVLVFAAFYLRFFWHS